MAPPEVVFDSEVSRKDALLYALELAQSYSAGEEERACAPGDIYVLPTSDPKLPDYEMMIAGIVMGRGTCDPLGSTPQVSIDVVTEKGELGDGNPDQCLLFSF